MKKKELNNLAKKIAEAELLIQQGGSKEEISKAKERILELSKSITSLEDITMIDELVQEILSQKI